MVFMSNMILFLGTYNPDKIYNSVIPVRVGWSYIAEDIAVALFSNTAKIVLLILFTIDNNMRQRHRNVSLAKDQHLSCTSVITLSKCLRTNHGL